MIAITGATGKVGSQLADLLLYRGEKVRVIGRSAEKLAGVVARGAEGALGDLEDREFLFRAFRGAVAVFTMIPPNFAAEDVRKYQNSVGESIAQAIRTSGVTHVVNLSSQGAELTEGTGPIKGLYDQEQRLNRLPGVHVLHLRPTYFMENLLMNIELIRKMGIMGSAVRGDVRFAMIATRDIAVHAADRLARRDFTGSLVQDLLGQRDVSLAEAAALIGKRINRSDLKYVAFPYEDAEKAMVGMGLSTDMSRQYIEMSRALNEGRFAVGVPRDAANTTPTTIEEFADTFAAIYRSVEKAA
jgi:uncharacterized protein YbjT (DUF2867 family)